MAKISKEDVKDILKTMGRELTAAEIDKIVAEHGAVYANSKEGTWDDVVLGQADAIIKSRTKYKLQTGEAGEVNKDDTNPKAKGWGTIYMADSPEQLLREFVDGINNDMIDTENMFLRVIVEK